MTLVTTDVSAQQKPTTGYAPVNGINVYYEVHGGGEPVVLLHGAFMTITNNCACLIAGGGALAVDSLSLCHMELDGGSGWESAESHHVAAARATSTNAS
jgi:pimeloyl-ACP methyl ester carboxylesterase